MNKDTLLLYCLSFFTNAAVLIFEIAGGRLLAPYLGTSVEVWAGTIAVVLGGMALGYHFGGKIGDKTASKTVIVHFLFGAGLAALIAWSVRDLVPAAISALPLPLTISALLIGAVLYMPTVILLAVVSPLIAKNLITGLENSARVVGTLNAVGTVGAIAGAVTTGLFLIPQMGIDWILLSVAILIFALALLAGTRAFMARAMILVLVGIGALSLNAIPTAADNAIADIGTPYNRILVYETPNENGETIRALAMDPFGTQCAMKVNDDGTLDERAIPFRYLRGFAATAEYALTDTPAPRALFLGGCNYSYPRTFLRTHPRATADVVEIDPGMTDVAKEHFGFDPAQFPSLSIFHEDARIFLNKHATPYDIIFIDVFGSAAGIPPHVTTKESFERVNANLEKNGTVVINVISAVSGAQADFTASLLKTVRSVFPYAEAYTFSGDPEMLQNFIIVASHNELPQGITAPLEEDYLTLTQTDDRGIVLTDTYAPVEYLTRHSRLQQP